VFFRTNQRVKAAQRVRPVAGPMTSFAPRSGFSLDALICSALLQPLRSTA
jgi:hypothetical protein